MSQPLTFPRWKSEQSRGELSDLLSDLPTLDEALLEAITAPDLSPVYRELSDVAEALATYRFEIERLLMAIQRTSHVELSHAG